VISSDWQKLSERPVYY